MSSFASFTDWAFRALLGGACLYVIAQIDAHSRQLDAIQSAIVPMQYDLKALSEKGAEQRESLRSLTLDLRAMERENWNVASPRGRISEEGRGRSR